VNIEEAFEIVKPKATFRRNIARKTRESDNPNEIAISANHPRTRNKKKAHVKPGARRRKKKDSKICVEV